MAESKTDTAVGSQDSMAHMDLLVGYLLLGGVLASAALIAAGLVWNYLSTGQPGIGRPIEGMNLAEFVGHEVMLAARRRFGPALFINSGIAVLLLTPYARVLASVLYFALGLRNWKYTLFTGFVLAVLTYSLFVR